MYDGPPVADDENNIEEKGTNTTRVGSSNVWKHFTRIGIVDGREKCKCDGCGVIYSCGASTSHLKCHIPKCHKIPKNHDVGVLDDNITFLKR